MKKMKLLFTLLFLFLYGGCACAQPKAPNLEFVRGDVLVVMDAPGGASDVEALSGQVAEATGSKVIRSYEAIADATGKYIFQLKSAEKSVDDLLAEVRTMPGVRGATPNYIVKILGTPDDPELPSSWGIEHINASEAWDLSTGGEDVYVAILDTGIKADHEDLAANIGQDRDGKFGRNLVSFGANPVDDNGHGTLVAGIVGAVGNNGLGTSGVNWTTRLLSVKVMDGNGAGSYGHVIAGLDYVLGQKKLGLNIRVASMAFGAWTPEVEDLDSDPLAVACRAVSDAGVLLVAAAGNEGQNIDSSGGGYKGNKIYPASLSSEGVLTVTAVMKSGAPVKSANYGLAVDVAAPGYEILSTAVDGGYKMMNGTSAASGFAAGAAALIAATDPELTASQVKERILEFAGRDKALAGKTASGHLNVGAAVKNERGSVTVAIEGPGSSRWSLDGKGRYESGYILAGVPVGEHTVSYHEVDLWTAPTDSLIAVAADAETEVGGQYRQQNASLWVVIEGPEEGGWSLNGEDRFESDQTIGNIAGKRTVTFSEVPGWDSPEPQAVTVPTKASLALTGVYKRQTGSVVVTIIGPEGSAWSLDGEGAYAGGEAAEGIPTGERTVSFAEVANWDKPANVSVQVEKDSSVYSRGVYVQHVGSIRVNIEGPGDASWAINGRGLYADGEIVSELPVGVYTLSFSAVRDWDSPSSIQVAVTRDSVAEVDRAYEKHTGSVAVAIDGPETAKWRLEGRDELLAGGETLLEVPVGEYTVIFSDVADWHTPENATVFVSKGSVGKAEGAYLQHKGSLTVDITEPVEATWSLDGEGVYASGEVVQGVVVGAHTISFSKVDDWDEPEELKVTVANESLAKAEVSYKRHLGAVQVNIDGPVEARWLLDGEGFHKDGETVKDLV
ncbi:MAG: S8 family serine peptidase, partial [Aminobacteriaceae bacterium]